MTDRTRRTITAEVLLGLFALGGSITSAQQSIPQPREASLRAHELQRVGKYLAALVELEDAARQPDSLVLQELATVRSFVGDTLGALTAIDQAHVLDSSPATSNDGKDASADLGGYSAVPALETIVELAKSRQIVILNEAHHVPQHREFCRQLAVRLRAEGFKWFAAETFTEPAMQDLQARGYPTRETGYYSQEPRFGELIREVLRLGYRPVAYETTRSDPAGDPVERINGRESDQSRNLIDRVFTGDPQARILIFVGYSHATENVRQLEDGRELAWMAARLARDTGLDPLTIDQTDQSERGQIEMASPEWRAAREAGWLRGPVLLQGADQAFLVAGKYRGAVDLQVFHPPAQTIAGRPDWIFAAGDFRQVSVDQVLPNHSGRLLFQAFYVAESDDAIPADQFVAVPGEPRSAFALRPGQYRIVVQDEAGSELQRQSIEVAADEPRESAEAIDRGTQAQAREEIRRAEEAFCAMAERDGVKAAFLAFAAEDAVLNRQGRIVAGREAIAKYFDEQPTHDVKLRWQPEFVDASPDGKLGYTFGPFTYTALDAAGKKLESSGVFHTVWRRQPDGSWKFVYD